MPDQQESCGKHELPTFPEYAESAWRMYCRGQRNWTQLAKTFNVDYRTVQSVIRKYGAAVRAAGSGSGVDAWQEALTAHEEVLAEAWRTHASADATPSEKLQALKVAQTSIEQIAVLNGVATKRSSVALGQDPDLGPVQVASTLALIADPTACALATQLIQRLSGGEEQIDGPEDANEAAEG